MSLSINRRTLIGSSAAAALMGAAGMPVASAQPSAARIPAADYYEILDLNARFCHGLDSGADEGRMFANAFTPDGAYVDATRTVQGSAQLAEMARGGKGPTNLVHFVVNIKVDPAPGGARQYAYVQIVGSTPDGHELVVDGGQYWDDLVKTAQGWRIRRRNFLKPGTPRPDPASIFTANPAGPAPRGPADPLSPLDRAQIIQLYSHYAVSFDKVLEDGATFADLFTADGVMVDAAGTVTAGRDKLMELAWSKGPIPAKTYFTNIMLEPTAAGVNARAYAMSCTIPPQPGVEYIVPAGMAFAQIVKTPAGWRFKRQTFVAPHAALPGEVAAQLRAPAGVPARAAKAAPAKAHALTAQDYSDIQHNYAQYAHGFDAKLPDWYFAVFTDTAEFTDQYDRKSVHREGLDQSYMRGRPVQPIAFTHSTWNVMIDPAPWGAAGRSYTGGGRANSDPTKPTSPGLIGDYVDIIVKTPDGWKFQQRKFFQDFVRPVASGAGQAPPQQQQQQQAAPR
jgi:hypothetical protein